MRLQAAQMFAQGMNAGQIAGLLQVSAKSVYQWRRAGRARNGAGWFRETHGGTSATRASLAAIRDDPDAFQGARQGANQG